MKSITAVMLMLAALAVAACSDYTTDPTKGPSYPASDGSEASAAAAGSGAPQGFGFNGTVSGFATGEVTPTGGASAGGFRCVDAVAQGPIAGCASGEGNR